MQEHGSVTDLPCSYVIKALCGGGGGGGGAHCLQTIRLETSVYIIQILSG